MYGGGGYEAGASQFGGGGFVASQNDNDNRSPGLKHTGEKRAGIRSVTIKQLKEACDKHTQQHEDIQSHQNVTLVAKVASMRDFSSSSMLEMMVWDGTGSFNVHYYIPEEDEQTMQKMSEWREGVYVRVYGALSEFEGNFRILAFNVRKVTDFNEVTYHNLQAIFQHAHLSKGGAGTGLLTNGDAAPQAAAAGPMGGSGDGNDVGNDGLTHTQRQVKSVLDSERHRENPDGLTADQVMAETPGMSHQQVQAALSVLMENGHAYTASDEFHYKSTSF
ncbi:hypothetical protein CVIRNUC_002408 [Coccomyxa viridis]|uniref:Replication protein A C-terminal domain-containing protein n=1 Tax=Coccomyxa viridis TaxID=1274662 RepID=A0AAV1HVU4_9CHLO|nr:hypothetical protein CVIRNUC_002408 [Coccomyxa viridis]